MLQVNRYILRLLAVAIVFGSVSSYRSVEPSYSAPLNYSSLIASSAESADVFVESENKKSNNKDYKGEVSPINDDLLKYLLTLTGLVVIVCIIKISVYVRDYFWRSSQKACDALVESAYVKCENKDYGGAIAECNAALSIDPESGNAYSCRSTIKWELGDIEGAKEDAKIVRKMLLKEAIAQQRNRTKACDAFVESAYVKCENKDYGGAIAECNTALSIDPESGNAYSCRSTIKWELGDIEGAEEDAEIVRKMLLKEAIAQQRNRT